MNQDNQSTIVGDAKEEAFQYLKSLPRRVFKDRNQVITPEDAEGFTDTFRGTADPFTIPISWNMDKAALISLLGITSYSGYQAISGIRLYAGINDNNQLTLIAVTTTDANNGSDDLTIDDEYPYFDYAYPCPNLCSTTGNLKVSAVNMSNFIFERVPSQ